MIGGGDGFGMIGGLFMVGVVLVIALAIAGAVQAQKRREAISTLSTGHGWTYVDRDDSWTQRFSGAPFGAGFDHQATNVVTGDYHSRFFVAFDYRYSTKTTTTDAQGHLTTKTDHHYYSVIALDLGVDFPGLAVEPEGLFSRLVGRLTNSDIELESEEFNKTFTVTCPDRKFASDVLHPQMMEYLLQHPQMAWRCEGGGLVAIRNGEHEPAEIESKLATLLGISTRIPQFVWQQFGSDSAR